MQQVTDAELMQAIGDKIKEMLQVNEEIEPEAELDQYGLDSITAVGLIVEVEELYNIVFEDDELFFDSFSSIQKIAEIVKGKLAAA